MGKSPDGRRKVIISTNICESSITIPDIRYVIDFCMTKFQKKCCSTNLVQLAMAWASEESCDQRKGRAGRTQAGTCYRLLTKEFFKHS
jgi:HrpA-like RNA helicase